MRFRRTLFSLVMLLVFTAEAAYAQSNNELRIDPLMLVSLKECRNITKTVGSQLFPGWDFQKTPVLFYRPKVQDLLINFPHKPKGFSEYHGFNPLGDETIYVRNDTTLIPVDDQNTSREIDGIAVLVVADPFSRMRGSLRVNVGTQTKEWLMDYLNGWGLIRPPYDELGMILHESFHVYQHQMAPGKAANEAIVGQYPILDPVNNALWVLEGQILRDALLQQNEAQRLEKTREFVAVRTFRQARLKPNWAEYENLNEYNEGIARYIEYKFFQIGQAVDPVKEMYFRNGFNGYRGVLPKIYQNRLDEMVNIVAVKDDRWGRNKFGAGPLRYKLYELGAWQAMLLDEVMPSWKEKIFNKDVYLSGLLQQSVSLSPTDLERYLEQAKSQYHYSEAYEEKLRFEKEGKARVQEQLDAILQTHQTLVKISFAGFADRIGFAYTPFGVTQITERSAIYDLIPFKVTFKPGVELQMKQVIPMFVDREKKLVAFAVPTPIARFGTGADGTLETDEFKLATTTMEIVRQGNVVSIQLK